MLSIKIPTVENSKVQLPKKAVPDVIKGLIKSSVEATSDFNQSSIDLHFHPFLNSAHNAFDEHLPFVISPDMLWLAIAQGFSQHINMNAEKYRSRFVSHEGKVAIHVIRNDFVRLSPTNPWEEVFRHLLLRLHLILAKKNINWWWKNSAQQHRLQPPHSK